MEIWKDIKGYEKKYKISNLGNIRSYCTGKEIIRKQVFNKKLGYYAVCLGSNNKQYVHRLLAQAFIPNQENKKQVNHKDGNRANNDLSNLEWVTCSENHIHAYKELKRIPAMLGRMGVLNKCSKKINQYTMDMKYIKRWDSLSDIVRNLKINNITRVCKGSLNSAGGFKWAYANSK